MNAKDRSPPIVWDEVSDVPPSMYEPRTTPRPWRAKPVPRAVRTAFLCAADGTVVSQRVEEMDDARLIVRAVNAHDAMREALAWALDQIEDDLDLDHQAALSAARAALALADTDRR